MNDDAIDPAPIEDDEVVAELRRLAAEVDPVPEQVMAAAHAAITTRHLDQELAVLIGDSAADADAAAAYERVRTGTFGSQTSRLLSFASGEVQVDLEINDHGDRLDLIGQVAGASIQECVLEYAGGAVLPLEVDELGRFLLNGISRGLVRARLRYTTGAEVVTAWVSL